ncbi:MAG: glycosyltransferase [Candidatus Dependentiae bacterium]
MKKKIIILSSSGGAGHIAATQALKDYLADSYDIASIDFMHVLYDIDVVKKITRGSFEAEQVFYNYCLKRRWFSVLNIVYQLGTWYFALRRKKITTIFKRYITDSKVDLVISVVPIINGALADAAQACNIPLIVVPTDLDATSFINGMKKINYDKLKMTTALDDESIKTTIAASGLTSYQIITTGFPLRKKFFEPLDKYELKKQHQVPANKPVIFLMMGGQGSSSIISFFEQLIMVPVAFHIIICIGKYDALRKKIETFQVPEHITYTIVGFTHNIAEYMAMADFAISKSGSVSVAELIYMNLPMLFDATGTLLRWERFNHTFVKKHGFGASITHMNDINVLVTQWLQNEELRLTMRSRLESFNKVNPTTAFPEFIRQML